ncbi:MAG: site-specific DNA-methyltransferase [Terriglobia bacterium]
MKFGSNFQPFVRKRDVTHGDDEDMTREPEMVQAYRDTWELGLHSYLTYLRDRFKIARELLTPSGSVFVQISDENVHHVREVMDEVFGSENFVSTIVFQKTTSEEGEGISNTSDYLLWFCRNSQLFKSHALYRNKRPGQPGAKQYVYVESPDRKLLRKMTAEELAKPELIPEGWKVCRKGFPLTSQDYSETRTVPFEFEGKLYMPGRNNNRHWSVSPELGLPSLVKQGRIYSTGESLSAIVYLDDMPLTEMGNVWTDTGTGSFTDDQIYVVQTGEKVIERCIQMATDPGDLILDPTCGGGTTAYCAEAWGRRWITVDVSRVPLALARQRLLTATFPYYRLKDETRGPTGGFEYREKSESRNRKIDGFGIVDQHTLSSIAGEEAPKQLVQRLSPEIDYNVTRITGAFCFESTIPAPLDLDADTEAQSQTEETVASLPARMIEILRKSPVLRLAGNQTITLKNIRPPAKSLSLSAEAVMVNGEEKSVALVFGPENAAISERLVYDAAREANIRGFQRLVVIGFAIEAAARQLIENCGEVAQIPATYIQATPDLIMTDLLKNMRSSQIFSVCGLPDIKLRRVQTEDGPRYEVQLLGLDTFDPVTMEAHHLKGDNVPAWFLDCNYNELCFHVSQAFFPRTSAWDNLKKALRATHQETVWDHLSGDTSAPFEGDSQAQIAVKVIDDRGNELLVMKKLSEAEG